MKSPIRARLLASSLLISAAAFAMPAYAQEVQEGDELATNADGSQEAGNVVVTGSRIARPDLTSSSPVTIVDSEQIELTGTVTLETLINDLPSVIPGNNRTSNNSGGFAFSTLDLRGLGPQRTLILVDGERLPASSASGVVDIAQIPTGLIERIDVVTGGATAVYGSDAISGVVNFVLKQNFEGLELTGQVGIAEEGVGFNTNVQGLFGGNFADNRGNITVFASYFDREGVSQSRFDYSRTSAAIYLDPTNRAYVVDDPSDIIPGSVVGASGGSATPPWGQVVNSASNPFNIAALAALYPTTIGAAGTPAGCAPSGSNLSFNDAGALTRYYGGGICAIPIRANGSSRYNFAPDNLLAIPYDRFNLSTTARYEFSDSTRMRLFAAYTNTNSEVNLAPTPAAGGTGFTIDPTRAQFIPADLRAALNSRPNPNGVFSFDRRFNETGPRIGLTESQTIVGRATVEHDLSDIWKIDGSFSWGRSDLTTTSIGNINRVAVEQGINGCVNVNGGIGGVGVLPGCVPVNIFGPNTLTPAMVNFIQTNTVDTQEFEQVRASVNVTGSLFELPGGPVGIAFGGEVRTDRGDTRPDDAKIRGEIIGFNQQQPTSGSITAREAYGEVRIPILGGGTGFPNMLAVELGARYSDYSSIGDIFNWKAAVEFAPVSWLRFRGAYNKAARAPSVFELFQNGDQGFPAYVDPCNSTNTGRNAAFCQLQGVPAASLPAFAQNNSQVQAFSFGQPDLQEEKAETYTAGVVITPDFFPLGRLSLTADYYDITIEGRIQSLSAQFYINQCATSADLSSDACQRVIRNNQTGQIDRVNTGRQNSPDDGGPFTTRGIDAGLNWVVPIADVFGGNSTARIRIAELFNYTIAYELGGTDFVDTGSGGLASVIPKFNNTLTVGYEEDNFTAQVRWVYKSGGSQVGQIFADTIDVDRIPDLSYFDLSLRYNVNDRFMLTGIVNNVFNKFPTQTVGGALFEQANANTSLFSPIIFGRSYTMQAQIKF